MQYSLKRQSCSQESVSAIAKIAARKSVGILHDYINSFERKWIKTDAKKPSEIV